MIIRIIMAAEQLYHSFTVTPRMRFRVVVYAEQQVEDQWIQMSSTELATFSMSNRRNPRSQDAQQTSSTTPSSSRFRGPSDAPGTSRGAVAAYFGCPGSHAGSEESKGGQESTTEDNSAL
jgi:hypothetical protein